MITMDVSDEDHSQFPNGLVHFLEGHEVVQELPVRTLSTVHKDTVASDEAHNC